LAVFTRPHLPLFPKCNGPASGVVPPNHRSDLKGFRQGGPAWDLKKCSTDRYRHNQWQSRGSGWWGKSARMVMPQIAGTTSCLNVRGAQSILGGERYGRERNFGLSDYVGVKLCGNKATEGRQRLGHDSGFVRVVPAKR